MAAVGRIAQIAALVLLLAASPAAAQFGKNKVQYEHFRWQTIETEHFDIYYYDGEEESARRAARMAERAYLRLSRLLRHEIKDRVPVIVYASHTDFQQTNISPGLIHEGVGGITEFMKRRVFLPFTGSYGEFDHVLTHELVHAFQVDLMFGAAGDVNPLSFQLPLWFLEGMAEYLSQGGLDPNTEMWLRWSALEGELVPLPYMDRVYDIRVYRIGQAIMHFIGTRFGDERIAELLRKSVYHRSVDIAFEKTLGMDLATLDQEWKDWVRRKYYPQIVDLARPDEYGRRLVGKKGFQTVDVAPALSPDGSRVAFIRDGRYSKDIILASAVDGKKISTLVKGERSGDLESLRYLYTAMGWSPDGTRLAFAAKRGGEDALNILDVDSRRIVTSLDLDFDAIYSPAWDPSGRRIAFSGIRGGDSDLFLVDLETQVVERLTTGPHMVRDPQWSPDGTRIAFVTDRGEDTDIEHLVFGRPKIAVLDVGTREVSVLPGQSGKNITPHWGPGGEHLAFVSDRDGISDLYVQDLSTGRVGRLTRLITGVTGITDSSPPFSWSRDGKRIVFTTFTGDGWELYAIDNPLERLEEIETPESLERVAERERETIVPWFAMEPIPANAPLAPAPVEGLAGLLAPSAGIALAGPGMGTGSSPESGTSGDGAAEGIVLSQVLRDTKYDLPDPDTLEGEPYKLRWSPDFIGASPLFASNVGFAGSAQIAVSDMLSNHVFQVGVSVYGSIEDSDILLGYYNLERRTNWGIAAYQYRNDFYVYTAEDGAEFESQIYRGFSASLLRPFSKFSRAELALRGTAVSERVFEQSFSGGFVTSEQSSSDLLYFLSPQISLVNDNTVWGSLAPVHGRRARISYSHAFGDVQSGTILGDVRQYFPIGRTTVFAVRVIGAASQGKTPQLFRVGGASTLRGLEYGESEGENLGLLNAEFRFPLVESLRLGWPLRVGLGSIGSALFFDIGGAWNDDARALRHGRLDDLYAGYGAGFRLGLGYFALKYDIAQRTDLRKRVGDSISYFTIGLDF